jgi:hypothetical protein
MKSLREDVKIDSTNTATTELVPILQADNDEVNLYIDLEDTK